MTMQKTSQQQELEKEQKIEHFSNLLNTIKQETDIEKKNKIWNNFIDVFPTEKELSKVDSKEKLLDVQLLSNFGNELLSVLSQDFNNLLFTLILATEKKKPILNFLTSNTIDKLIERENFNYKDNTEKSFLNYYFFKHKNIQNVIGEKIGKMFGVKYESMVFTQEQFHKIVEKSDVNILDESFDNALHNLFLNYDNQSNLFLNNEIVIDLIEKTDFKYIHKNKDRNSIFMDAFNNDDINLAQEEFNKLIDKGFKENPNELIKAIIFNKSKKMLFSENIITTSVTLLNKDELLRKEILELMFKNKINKNCLHSVMYDFLIENSTVRYGKSKDGLTHHDNLFHYLFKENFLMNDEIFNRFVEKNINEFDHIKNNIFSFLIDNLERKYQLKESMLDKLIDEVDINKNNKYKEEKGVNAAVKYLMHQKESGILLNEKQFDIFINRINTSIKDHDDYNILHNVFQYITRNDYELSSSQLFKLTEKINLNDVTENKKNLGHFYIINETTKIPNDFLNYVFENMNPLTTNVNGNNFIESYFIRELKKNLRTEGILELNDPYIAKILNNKKIPNIKPWLEEILKGNFHIEPYFFKGIINQIEPTDLFKINNKHYLYEYDNENRVINFEKLAALQEKSDGKNRLVSFSIVCLDELGKKNNVLFGYKENIDLMKDILVKYKLHETNEKNLNNQTVNVTSISNCINYLFDNNKPIPKEVWGYIVDLNKEQINYSMQTQSLLKLLTYEENHNCIDKKDLITIFSKVKEEVITEQVVFVAIERNLFDILPPKLLNNMEVAYKAIKKNQSNFVKLGNAIKNELKLNEENSYNVLHDLLKKDNKFSSLLNRNKIKKLQENINKRIIQETNKLIEHKDMDDLINNMLNINEELKKIKENTQYITEVEEDLSDINRSIYKEKVLLIEKLLKSNDLNFDKIKNASDKIEKIKNETKETLHFKIKSEVSIIKYIQKAK